MKKLAIAFALVLCVLTVGALFAVRNLNTYLDENRPWITTQVESALGRPVEIGGLRASLGWGVSAQITELAVADDPAFSKESFLRAGEALARVSLLPLLSGRVEVGRVVIRKPEIRVIQNARGMNIDSLGAGGETAAAEPSPAEEPGGAANAAIAIALFRVEDGTLRYVDTRAEPASEIEVGGLDVDFRSDGDLDAFRGRLAIAASRLRLRSGGGEDDAWEPLRLSADLERQGDVLHIRNADLRAADLQLRADATLSGLSATPSVEATFSSPGGEVAGIPFAGLDGALRYAEERASFESLVLRVFDGEVSASGVYNMRNPGRPSFEFDTKIDGVRVEQILRTQPEAAAAPLEGEVQSALTLAGTGADWSALKKTLWGSGEFDLIDGVLRDINLAETALGGLKGVPGLSELLDAELRAKYPALFGGEDTRFERVDLAVQIGGGEVRVRELAVAARDFAVEGAGRLGLDGALELPTRLVCSEALSEDLVERQATLAALRGPQGRLEFPMHIGGNLPEIRVVPDVAAVAKVVGADRARALLDKVLRGRQGEGGSPSEDAGGAENASDSSKQLLQKGLDSLFGR